MLVYIIDGFNLIHRVAKLKNSPTPREDLIRYIRANRLTGSRRNKVIIVFDGFYDHSVIEQTDFQIIFSDTRKADDLIKAKVDNLKNRSEVRVVSDDRAIRDYITRSGAVSVRLEEFIPVKREKPLEETEKDIDGSLQKEITDQMRKIWLKEE